PTSPRVMPVILKMQWILFNISSNSSLVVTSGYWLFIAFLPDTPLLTSHMSRFKHTINTICVLADVMTSATPIRLYHMFYTFFFGSLYVVFSAMNYIVSGNALPTNVVGVGKCGRTYYFMNWAAPVETVCTCVLGIMLSTAWQLLLHGLYKFRLWLSTRWYSLNPSADSELQNIITSSESYNSLEESYK
ncbi:unnamed protein product, partial [Candidula unifasciata]